MQQRNGPLQLAALVATLAGTVAAGRAGKKQDRQAREDADRQRDWLSEQHDLARKQQTQAEQQQESQRVLAAIPFAPLEQGPELAQRALRVSRGDLAENPVLQRMTPDGQLRQRFAVSAGLRGLEAVSGRTLPRSETTPDLFAGIKFTRTPEQTALEAEERKATRVIQAEELKANRAAQEKAADRAHDEDMERIRFANRAQLDRWNNEARDGSTQAKNAIAWAGLAMGQGIKPQYLVPWVEAMMARPDAEARLEKLGGEGYRGRLEGAFVPPAVGGGEAGPEGQLWPAAPAGEAGENPTRALLRRLFQQSVAPQQRPVPEVPSAPVVEAVGPAFREPVMSPSARPEVDHGNALSGLVERLPAIEAGRPQEAPREEQVPEPIDLAQAFPGGKTRAQRELEDKERRTDLESQKVDETARRTTGQLDRWKAMTDADKERLRISRGNLEVQQDRTGIERYRARVDAATKDFKNRLDGWKAGRTLPEADEKAYQQVTGRVERLEQQINQQRNLKKPNWKLIDALHKDLEGLVTYGQTLMRRNPEEGLPSPEPLPALPPARGGGGGASLLEQEHTVVVDGKSETVRIGGLAAELQTANPRLTRKQAIDRARAWVRANRVQ